MASSSSDPSPQIAQAFKDLFSWNPPQLFPRPLPGKKVSTKTRSPVFFDKHCSEKLTLLHVKLLPSLVHDITAVVDTPITGGVDSPELWLFSAKDIEKLVNVPSTRLSDEKGVACFYDKTTATFCQEAASILALGFPHLVKWTQSGNVSGYAIAEGFLHFDDVGMNAQLEKIMDQETINIIQLLADKLASLATFEFKNLAAGGADVMLAIPKLANLPKFGWTFCESLDCATSKTHENERRKVSEAEANMWLDAKTTPWSFDRCSDNQVPPVVQGPSKDVETSQSSKRKRDSDSDNESEAGLSSSTLGTLLMTPQANPPLGTPEAEASKVPGRKSARIQKINDMRPPPPPPPAGRVPGKIASSSKKGTAKGKGKEVVTGKGGQSGNNKQDRDHPLYKDKHGLSASYIIQQAWAQATRADSSVIVISSGNHEFIGVRHRSSRTLYLSNEIVPHACTEPSYGKLHVGIYMAAIRDAIDRERQRMTNSGDSNGGGPSGGPGGGGPSGGEGDHKDDGGSKKPKKGGSKKSKGAGSKDPQGEGGTGRGSHMMAITAHERESTLKLAIRRNVLLLYLQYGVYDSPVPSMFIRSGQLGQPNPLPSRQTVRNYKLEQCLTVVLKSEIGHGATGEVLRGTLEVEASACGWLDVAVKLALASGQRDALRNEYKMYHLLKKSGVTTGITTPLGLFDDVEDEACALVMPYAGIPLADVPEKTVLATLKDIHQANILHGDIRLENVLVADSGLMIIDFAQSRVCYDQGAKDREYLQLQSLLRQHA